MDLDHGNQGYVDALARFETGGRSVLCAGGLFAYAGGQPASNVASWDGASWTPLGSGIDGRVIALTTFDDGSGPALYAAGYFSTAGSMPANNIAKWNGSAWAPLGSGIRAASYWEGVLALAVFDDGSGSALYAGGGFATAGGLPASGIARWNGTRWEPVGRGIGGSASAFTIFDDGAGEALYVGGDFHRAGGERATGIARWNSSGWTAVLNAPNWTGALAVFDDRTGGGADLYAGGPFVAAGHFASSAIAKWRECAPIPSLR